MSTMMTEDVEKDEFAETGAAPAEALEESGELLLKQCSRVRVRKSRFSQSGKVDNETAMKMIKDTGADVRSVSISKRFMNCKHDALKAVSAALKAIDDHVYAWTIPLLALRATADASAGLSKDAGIRLIQKKDMADFDSRLQYLIGVLRTAVDGLQAALPEIKALERSSLGKLYRESDYPRDVTKMVGVTVSYEPVGIDVDWEQLCPEIYKREAAAARTTFAMVVENAAAEFAKEFVGYVDELTNQLGNRRRLNPAKDKGWEAFRDAEEIEVVGHDRDPDLPAGHVAVHVRLKKAEGVKGRSDTIWLDPMPRNRYESELRPYETGDRRRISTSTVDNIKAQLERFLGVGDMLGPYREVIGESVERVKAQLAKAAHDLNSDTIAQQLRTGEYFRNAMSEVLVGVKTHLESAIESAKPVRRKVVAAKKE